MRKAIVVAVLFFSMPFFSIAQGEKKKADLPIHQIPDDPYLQSKKVAELEEEVKK